MPKDRGIENVERYFGNFIKLVEDKIRKKGKVKILDAGCGYGVAMMGFLKRFGNKVEIIGYNYSSNDGNTKIMKQQAVKRKIFTKQELSKIKKFPKFYYIDASKKLPFKNNEFDFIYSMASIYLYDKKIKFLEECNRILKKDGLARISPTFNMDTKKIKNKIGNCKPGYYMKYWEIWDKGKEIQIENYCKKIKGVKAVWGNKYKGDKPMYIEIIGNGKVDFKLQFISSIDYNFIWKDWGGVKSIYTTQKKFRPKWKSK